MKKIEEICGLCGQRPVAAMALRCWWVGWSQNVKKIEEIRVLCDRCPVVVMALCCKKKYLHFARLFISKMRMIPDNKNIKGEYQ